jgi:hypothetical protein
MISLRESRDQEEDVVAMVTNRNGIEDTETRTLRKISA